MFDLCFNRQTPYTADREEGEDLPTRHQALSSVPTWPPPVPLRCLAIPAVPASAFALFGHSRCPRQCLCAVWPFPLSPPVPLSCSAIPAVPASAFALFGHSRCPRQCFCAVWPFPLSPPLIVALVTELAAAEAGRARQAGADPSRCGSAPLPAADRAVEPPEAWHWGGTN